MQNCYVPISALKNFMEPVSVSVAQIVGIICGPDLFLQTQTFFSCPTTEQRNTLVYEVEGNFCRVFFFWMEKQ